MLTKTDLPLKNIILTWAALLISAALLFFICAMVSVKTVNVLPDHTKGFLSTLPVNCDPGLIAGAEEVLQGINDFASPKPQKVALRIRLLVLLTLLAGFVLGPSLLIYSVLYYSRHGNFTAASIKDFLSYPRLLLIAGLALIAEPAVFGVIRPVFSGAALALDASKPVEYMKRTVLAENSRNNILLELHRLAYEAGELTLIRKNGQGGAGTFLAAKDAAGKPAMLKLEMLPYLSKTQYGKYTIAPESCDTMLIIYGTGTLQGDIPGFKNSDGSTGKIEHSISITKSFLIKAGKRN